MDGEMGFSETLTSKSARKSGVAELLSKIKDAWSNLHAVTGRVFPQHQIYFRTNGNVRYFTVSTKAQMGAVSVAGLIAGWLVFASSSFWLSNDALLDKERALAAQQQQMAALQGRITALHSDMSDLKSRMSMSADRIQARQTFLQNLFANRMKIDKTIVTRMNSAEVVQPKTPLTREQEAALKDLRKVENSQMAFVGTAAQAADARYAQLDGMLRRMGLSAQQMAQATPGVNYGTGGPLVKASLDRGAYSTLQPEFKDLYMSWTKLDLLQRAMLSIPAFLPTKNFQFTSGFGNRYDPFNGGNAQHAGVDMAGPLGTPIYASADGVVVRAGWVGAYGNMVEIDHGRGLTTRYGHLSAINVNVGERVSQGDVVAAMGSTGRSTGSHLHYEVRINGAAVNPMPFLEAARDVLEVQQAVDVGAPIADPAG
jgi:murein DD-endopeptidase MepM/ murein hydrolase activator NlpD